LYGRNRVVNYSISLHCITYNYRENGVHSCVSYLSLGRKCCSVKLKDITLYLANPIKGCVHEIFERTNQCNRLIINITKNSINIL
jgi:hypothetical protein